MTEGRGFRMTATVITKPPEPRHAKDKQQQSYQRMQACADLPIVSAGLFCRVTGHLCWRYSVDLSILCIFTKKRVTHGDGDDEVCVFVRCNTLVKGKVGQGADGRTFG